MENSSTFFGPYLKWNPIDNDRKRTQINQQAENHSKEKESDLAQPLHLRVTTWVCKQVSRKICRYRLQHKMRLRN